MRRAITKNPCQPKLSTDVGAANKGQTENSKRKKYLTIHA